MFDPYRKWLGIPPKDQPPNHYRLLGLELYEDDLDVIEGAADRQMGFVRQYQSGEFATDAARILNELAQARLCLLKPASKSAYDAKLRKELTPAEPEPEAAFAELPLPEVDLNTETLPIKRKKSKKKATGSGQQLMIAGGIGASACVLLLIFILSGSRKPPAKKVDDPIEVAAVSPAKPKIEKERSKEPEAANPTFPKPASTTPKSVSPEPPKLVSTPSGEPVDLLKQIDFKRDVVAGEWKLAGTALVGGQQSRIYLPVKLPEDYQLKFTVRRIEGADALQIGFMMGGRQGIVAFDGWEGKISGLYADDEAADNTWTAWRETLFKNHELATIVLTIHPSHFHAAFNEKTIVDWYGNAERLHLHSPWVLPCREQPYITIFGAKYTFESAQMVPILPEPPEARPTRLDKPVDVLPLVSVEQDSAGERWAVDKNSLSAPQSRSLLRLPLVVPVEYTISATAELPLSHQGEYTLTIALLASTAYFQFASTSGDMGLDMIDGKRWNGNETRMPGPLLKPGVPTRIDCTVTTSGIRVDVDGKTQIDWRGDIRRLSMIAHWAQPDGRRLFLAGSSRIKFRDITLGPPLDPPKLPEHSPMIVGKPLDLLALIDPVRDAISGSWERDGTSIRCRGDLELNVLSIPVETPSEYRVTARVARIQGGKQINEAMLLGLPGRQSHAVLGIDSYQSAVSGAYLDQIVDLREIAGAYRGKPAIPVGTPHDVVVHVRNTGFGITSDGTSIMDWTGNPARCSIPADKAPLARRLAIGSWQQGFRFDKLELEPLPPTSFPPVPPLGTEGKLIPILNVDRDSRRGDWKLDGDGLISPPVPEARLRIPVKLPRQYAFTMNVERKQGSGDLFVGLVVDGHPCTVVIDAFINTQAGIDQLDGKSFFDMLNLPNRKYKEPLLPPNQSVAIRCFVLPDTIVVTCGDKQVIRWHGDPRRLSPRPEFIPPNYSDDDRTHLCIGSVGPQFVFRDLELKPLGDAEADQLSKSFSGVFPTTSQVDMPLTIYTPGQPSPPSNPTTTSTVLETSWLLKRKAEAPALLVMDDQKEHEASIQACRQARLPFDLYPEFPPPDFDYSKFSMIVVGSNLMDYWGSKDRQDPKAFQPLATFVNGGGHLMVFNTFNGRNMEHLRQFGVQTGVNHLDTYQMIPGVSDIVFNGAEDLIPAGTYLKQSGNFVVDRPHAVLLRRGSGSDEGGPTVATIRHGAGRVTYSSVEPFYGDPPGFWLEQALIRWGARGAPVTKSDLAEVPSIPAAIKKTKDDRLKKNLEIVEARYGISGNPVVVTSEVSAAAKSGILVMIADSSLTGGDPVPGAVKNFFLRYRLNGIEEFQKLPEYRAVVLGAKAGTGTVRGNDFKLLEVGYGVGLYNPQNPVGWIDVTEQFRPLAKKNGLNPTAAMQELALAGKPDPYVGVAKSLVVHYQYQGRDTYAVFPNGALISVADPPADKQK